MNIKLGILFLFLFAFCNNAISQTETIESIEIGDNFSKPGLILKWSPSPLASVTAPTIQFSLEYPIGKNTKRVYLEQDFGYVYRNPERDGIVSSGARIANRIKFYFIPTDETTDHLFISVMGRYSFRVENGNDWFERAGGAFEQRLEFTKRSNFYQGFMELGYMGRFGEKKRFIFETTMGAGLMLHTADYKDIPDDALEPDDFNNGFVDFTPRQDEVLPSLIVVMKFGYVLK